MAFVIITLFVLFHAFILIFPRVVFTKNVSPSSLQLASVRAFALFLLMGVIVVYWSFYI